MNSSAPEQIGFDSLSVQREAAKLRSQQREAAKTNAEEKFYKALDEFHGSSAAFYSCTKPQKGLKIKGGKVDLFGLFKAVEKAGGHEAIVRSTQRKKGAWTRIAKEMGNDWSGNGMPLGHKARVWYEKHLLEYEVNEREMEEEREANGKVAVITDEELGQNAEGEEVGQNAEDRVKTLQEKLVSETEDILEQIRSFKRKLHKELKADSITRPLEDKVNEIRMRPWPGNKTVILGANGLGKSFCLDLIIRGGCVSKRAYELENYDDDMPLEAVLEEAQVREQAELHSSGEKTSEKKSKKHEKDPQRRLRELVRKVKKECAMAPEIVAEKEQVFDGYLLRNEEKRQEAMAMDQKVQLFCETEERTGKFESFVLPAESRGQSTTCNSIVIKRAKNWQLKCSYYTQQEVQAKLEEFPWEVRVCTLALLCCTTLPAIFSPNYNILCHPAPCSSLPRPSIPCSSAPKNVHCSNTKIRRHPVSCSKATSTSAGSTRT
jgi:hypothetical protein